MKERKHDFERLYLNRPTHAAVTPCERGFMVYLQLCGVSQESIERWHRLRRGWLQERYEFWKAGFEAGEGV